MFHHRAAVGGADVAARLTGFLDDLVLEKEGLDAERRAGAPLAGLAGARRDAEGRSFHERALPMLGLPLGEIFVLAPLAEDCARDGRYEFMLVSCPLNLEGGVASPPNAVAIK